MEITIVIDESVYANYVAANLALHPVPMFNDEPIMTEEQWIKELLKKVITRHYKQCLEFQATNNINIGEDDISYL